MICFTNRYLKSLLLFVVVISLIALPIQLLAGTTGKISGQVIDAKTGEPLVGANILIQTTTMGAATDENGYFYILNIAPGEYSVRASMVGYSAVIQTNVRISPDKTTNLSYSLSDISVESEEVIVTASRPLVEKDVGASQIITTTREASLMPVSDIMDAVSLEPGIVVTENRMEVSIRGGGSDQISFQVDGMERTDKLNNKTYTPTNSATVEEIQVLKGGFNAEYGNLRSGMFNVVTKTGGSKFSGSADYRMAPGQQKHFGPNAYGEDQYDYKIYGGSNSFAPVKDIEGNTLFIGWDALAVTRNGESYKGKSDWTPQQLQEVWQYQHRPIEYGETPDHYLDFGISGPIGLNNSGFLLGVKYNRIQPIFPTIRGYDQILSYEGKLNFQLSQSMNLMVSGLYGESETSTNGDTWGNQGILNYGYDIESTSNPAVSTDSKYYLAFNNPMDVSTSQIGFKFTHTLNQSTFYELRYTYFTTDSETRSSADRNTAGVKTIGGVEFDEGPIGWVHTSESLRDITGTYAFSGGGRVEDVSSAKSHLINFDMTSQVTKQHMLKFGLMFSSDNLIKDYYGASTIILDPDAGDFVNFENSPYQISGYIQDKVEYGGLIANIGLRIEHYAANGDIYDPGNLYSAFWARGGTAGYDSPDDLPSEASKSYTYLAPRISFSHPVQEFTKFFFNFGIYYSEPTTLDRYGLYSESWAFGNPAGDIRRLGYPNLEPAKTSAYEVGFEQAIGNDWLIRAYFYSKDNSQQIGDVRFNGLDGTGYTGTFINYASSGGAASYNSKRNNQYQTIRGIEMKVTKRMGRFFTGWINMNYAINTSGNYGISNYNQDPLAASLVYAATKQQPQTTPGLIANFNVHTPSEYGKLWGQWSLSVNQFWTAGTKYFYNPTNLPIREIKTVYYWVDNFLTNLRLSKFLEITDFLNARIYLDVRNVFDFEALNISGLDSREQDSYFTNVVDSESGLGNDIGEVEDKNGNNVFSDNWVDKDGNNRAPIAPTKDFALSLNPRSFLIGIKLEF